MERHGDMIGPFRLLEQIGSGGFGVVWKAERLEPFRQVVAIKVIKAGMDTHAVLARFDAERRTLARMEHAGIARVLDGGMTPAGRPYFVMEFVEGVPITRFADAARIDLRARVSLLADAADAVQHAHAKGVIHRDLKPSNILVARDEHGAPRVKVIDFGVAKSLADDGPSQTMTEAGQLVGTPEYMSPEQADAEGLDVDTRSDVYGLGAVLYELLVGAAPFGEYSDERSTRDSSGTPLEHKTGMRQRAEILRRVAEELPPRPSARIRSAPKAVATDVAAARATDPATLSRTLAAELEWIPQKALRKEPEARYASAAALATDLRNWLEGRALDAGPESALYRLRALARRNRTAVAAAGFALTALLTAAGISAYFAWNESVARADAEAKAEEARRVATFQARILDAIEPNWVGAQIMQDLVNNHAVALKASEPDADTRKARREKLWAEQGLVNLPDLGRTVIERWILGPTAESLDAELAQYPVAAAAMRHMLASRRFALGDPIAAKPDIERALLERRRLLGDLHPDTLESMLVTGRVLGVLGEYEPALALLDECARGYAAVLGAVDPMTLVAAQTHATLLVQIDPVRAVSKLEEIVGTRRRLQGTDHAETAGAERDLGSALLAADRAAEAEPILRAAYDARVAAMGAEAQGTIYALLELVICLRVRGETEEAIPLARTCVAAATKQFGARNFSTLHARATLASLLATAPSETEHAEALAIAEAAHVAAERTLGPSNPTTLRCLLAEAHSHEALAQHGESLRLLDELDARLRDPRVGLRTFAREVAAFRSTIAPSP
jgi:non-specific serine/threonine protein kinase/serine/threonine-protein kinase